MNEYFLYATQLEPPLIEAIRENAALAGWKLLVARDWKDWSSYSLIDRGYLQNNDLTVGWMFRWPEGLLDDGTPPAPRDVEDALQTRDRERIEELIRLFEIGAASWIVDRPFEIGSHLEFGTIQDARNRMGNAYADHVQKAKCKYTVLNCEHAGFQRLVMGCVASLTDGILEDPMSAVAAFPPKDPRQLAALVAKSWHSW
jgi:hypothetical protein